jgi:hypothetical protein
MNGFRSCKLISTEKKVIMKQRLLSLLITGLTMFTGLSGQTRTPSMSFASEVHDFGKIMEADGPKTWKFEFTNTGAIPLVISNVTASCGCTSPSWSREPVLPGASGFISATYDPKNRPGKFEKTITVTSNADRAAIVLKISGDVQPKVSVADNPYMVTIGSLKMKTNHIGFNEINLGGQKTIESPVFNSGTSSVEISFADVPKHLIVIAKPAMLKPGETGVIEVSYNADIKNAWGFVTDRIQILENGKAPQFNRITISATITEDFSKLSDADLAAAPAINFEKDTYNFGTVKAGDIVAYQFVYTNTGKRDLVVHDVSASCGCTSVNSAGAAIKPGQKGTVNVKFNSSGREGDQNKTITVISNDPKNTRVILYLKGVVTQ